MSVIALHLSAFASVLLYFSCDIKQFFCYCPFTSISFVTTTERQKKQDRSPPASHWVGLSVPIGAERSHLGFTISSNMSRSVAGVRVEESNHTS